MEDMEPVVVEQMQWPADMQLGLLIQEEADNQTLEVKTAVAHTVLNRANRGGWWGSTISTVIWCAWQYEPFNEDRRHELVTHVKPENLTIARMAMKGLTVDQLGATHFHDASVSPSWKEKIRFINQVGDLWFYYE